MLRKILGESDGDDFISNYSGPSSALVIIIQVL